MHRRQFTRITTACLTLPWVGDRLRAQETASLEANAETERSLAGPAEGPWRRLFLDASVVEQQAGLARKYHSAEKYANNPIIVADRPWEGKSAITGPYVYGTILREDDRYRMWYQLLFHGNHVGYAESTDAIHWQKPVLDIIRYQDQATNLVVSDLAPEKAGGRCHNPTVIRRPAESDPQRRYALYGFDGKAKGPRVAFSSDGLHWSYPAGSEAQPLFASSDVVNFGYDPYQSRYFSTWKTRNRRGRAVGIAWSSDGEKWHKPFEGPIFVADDLDPDDTQIYGMPVFAYQGMYIGLPWIYRARYFRFGEYSVDKLHEAQADSPRTMDVQLAWSWDQVNWTRAPAREEFIPRGKRGSWDGGMIITACAPVIVGDQLYFYYGGTDLAHDEKRVQASIGLATMRLDGFCSMSSDASNEGWLITRREPFRQPLVTINARTLPGGVIMAEILDRNNRVIAGFSRQDCVPFQGDAVRHRLTWKTPALPSTSSPTDYKIRFWIKNAALFSYLPAALDPNENDLARFPSVGP